LVTKAVKIGLGSDEVERVFQVPSNGYIDSLAREFWNLPVSEDVEIVPLFSSTSEFADNEFTTRYESFFNHHQVLDNIYIEFGAPQYDGAISNRTFRVLLGFINYLRMQFGSELKILLALPKKFAKSSPGGRYLEEHMSGEMKNASIYLYKEHSFLCSCQNEQHCNDALATLEEANRELFLEPSKRLGHKVVCHLGKFQMLTDKSKNVYDFYDGSRASSEVYVILRNAFRGRFKATEPKEFTVLFDEGGLFDWFRDALLNAEKFLRKNDDVRLRIISTQNYLHTQETAFPDLILCPVIRTGHTLTEIVGALKTRHPGKALPEIMCLIFAAGEDTNVSKDILLPSADGEQNFQVKAVVQRGARGKFLKEIWKETTFQAQSPEDLLNYDKEFSSASMWGMLFETELTTEVADRARRKLHRIPNFLDLFRKNRPLFVHKIKAIEDSLELTGRFKYIIPDEAVPRELAKTLCNEHEDTSIVSVSANLLQIAAGFRDGEWEDLESHVDNGPYSDALKNEFSELGKLRTYLSENGGYDTSRQSYCILDTCKVTGKTMLGLETTVKMLGGHVAAAITLADFSLMEAKQKPSPKFKTLYTFGSQAGPI
jgi:hypothetical protein